jgi:hypothetical protein
MKESAVEEHRGQEGKDLFKRREVSGDLRIRISCGDHSEEKEGFFHMRALHELPKERNNIQNNDNDIDGREVF